MSQVTITVRKSGPLRVDDPNGVVEMVDADGNRYDLTGKTATVAVAYSGQVPDSFGPGVDVVVTGRYEAQAGAIAADELQTKCPSKYKASASPSP